MTRTVDTQKATLAWSSDGRRVTKRVAVDAEVALLGSTTAALRNEIRVNRMLLTTPPPVRVPRLLASDRGRALTVEAIDGDAVGPKFPVDLPAADVHELTELVLRLGSYRPRRRWFRRFDAVRRLDVHRRSGVIADDAAASVSDALRARPLRYRFAHGDPTARNVLRDRDGLVLIDWEWAGLYPAGYDLAFLWFSLVDSPAGRVDVEARVHPAVHRSFLLSALFVQLQHLEMWSWRGRSIAPAHAATKNHLLAEVAALRRS